MTTDVKGPEQWRRLAEAVSTSTVMSAPMDSDIADALRAAADRVEALEAALLDARADAAGRDPA